MGKRRVEAGGVEVVGEVEERQEYLKVRKNTKQKRRNEGGGVTSERNADSSDIIQAQIQSDDENKFIFGATHLKRCIST